MLPEDGSADDKPIDTEKYHTFIEVVRKAREDLSAYVQEIEKLGVQDVALISKFQWEMAEFRSRCGGAEGLSMKAMVATCDADGDGIITHGEMKRVNEALAVYLGDLKESMLQSGVIAALILSFIAAYSVEPLEASEDFLNYFGHSRERDFKIATTVVTNASILLCVLTIFVSARMMTVAGWITPMYGRVIFSATTPVAAFPILQEFSVWALILTLSLRGTVVVGPLQGLCGLLTLVIAWSFIQRNEFKYSKMAKAIQYKHVCGLLKLETNKS